MIMDYCFLIIALILIALQTGLLIHVWCCYRDSQQACARKNDNYQPPTALIVPCKGLDINFENNITSLFNQDFDHFLLYFVVDDQSDPAYEKLQKLKDKLASESKAKEIEIFIAGPAANQGQKVHNLLYCCNKVPEDIQVLAFADSDICVKSDWLKHLIHHLKDPQCGATTGYRWFVPEKNNLATLALVSMNAQIVQLLSPSFSNLNQAWGGSMAIKVQTFKKAGVDQIWKTAISDDLSLTYAIKKAGLKIIYVPSCLVSSYEKTTWSSLFEFIRRQFVITRVSIPSGWWLLLLGYLLANIGLWAGVPIAAYAISINHKFWILYTAVPVIFLMGQIFRATTRQKTAAKILAADKPKMKIAAITDIALGWFWSFLLLLFLASSAIGRKIRWRGVRYKLINLTNTQILD